MHELLAAAQDQGSAGFDWSGLSVPVIAGSAAIVVAILNTRGETAALRRLKAMNDVIEKLPKDSEVLSNFSAARDVLAQRVAIRVTGPKPWKKIPAWGFGVIAGVLALAFFVVMLTFFWPPAITGFPLVWRLAAASSIVGVVTWSFSSSVLNRVEARRRVEAAKRAHPSRGQL